MPDDYRIARFRAALVPRPPPPRPRQLTPIERDALLMGAKTMSEIREAAERLGLTFNAAYAERKRLYEERWGI